VRQARTVARLAAKAEDEVKTRQKKSENPKLREPPPRPKKKGTKASSLPPPPESELIACVRAEKRSHSFNRFELTRVCCGIPRAIHILEVKRKEREEI